MNRAYTTGTVLFTLAGFLLGTLAAALVVGHLLVMRDQAWADRTAAERREETCLAGWHRTVERAAALRVAVRDHLAIDDETCARGGL